MEEARACRMQQLSFHALLSRLFEARKTSKTNQLQDQKNRSRSPPTDVLSIFMHTSSQRAHNSTIRLPVDYIYTNMNYQMIIDSLGSDDNFEPSISLEFKDATLKAKAFGQTIRSRVGKDWIPEERMWMIYDPCMTTEWRDADTA